jgi:hypothetical protein
MSKDSGLLTYDAVLAGKLLTHVLEKFATFIL